MDKLKSPETAIGLFNTAALLGASIYFYKKINTLETELNKHSEKLTSTVKKVGEMTVYKKHITTIGNILKETNYYTGENYKEIEILKEFVRFQSRQIEELQSVISTDTELKLKDNPNILSYKQPQPRQLAPQQPQFTPGQPHSIQLLPKQGFPAQQFPQQQPFQQPSQGFPSQQGFPAQQFPQQQPFQQPSQGFPSQQGFPAQQQPFQQPSQGFPPQQQFPQQPQQQPFQQPSQQGFPGFNNDMLNFGFDSQQQSQADVIEDEDAAINAVRRARQQNTSDSYF